MKRYLQKVRSPPEEVSSPFKDLQVPVESSESPGRRLGTGLRGNPMTRPLSFIVWAAGSLEKDFTSMKDEKQDSEHNVQHIETYCTDKMQ